ncbi:uncharacterized protein [Anabrus simplex]|uniref:uncharacterized protein isoform X3 n=1 Tax=Anabrus simplex TaxID=316456 RepID=UPI0035A2BE0A
MICLMVNSPYDSHSFRVFLFQFMFLVIALLMSLAMAVIVVNLAHVDRLDSQPSSLQLILLKLELMFLMIAVFIFLMIGTVILTMSQRGPSIVEPFIVAVAKA